MRTPALIDPARIAVVLVDLQRAYCDPASDAAARLGWEVSAAEQVCRAHGPFLESLRALLPPERILWLAMEESPITYATNTAYGPALAPDPTRNSFVALSIRGTPGHDFYLVRPAANEPVFLKVHPSGFSNLDFRLHLDAYQITQLALTGVIGSRCVNATAITASSLGYQCLWIGDLIDGPAHLALEMKEHLKVTTFFYASLISSQDFVDLLTNSMNEASRNKI